MWAAGYDILLEVLWVVGARFTRLCSVPSLAGPWLFAEVRCQLAIVTPKSIPMGPLTGGGGSFF